MVKRVLKPSWHLTGTSDLSRDRMYKALSPGKRRSEGGKIYYEHRRNRADVHPHRQHSVSAGQGGWFRDTVGHTTAAYKGAQTRRRSALSTVRKKLRVKKPNIYFR